MRPERLRQVGQAITALSAVVIVYATLRPNLRADVGDDTMAHFLLFFPLGIGGALWMAQLEPRLQRRARLGILLIGLFFAAATEIAQGPIDGRSPSFTDFVADAAGLGTGLLAGGWLTMRAHRRHTDRRSTDRRR